MHSSSRRSKRRNKSSHGDPTDQLSYSANLMSMFFAMLMVFFFATIGLFLNLFHSHQSATVMALIAIAWGFLGLINLGQAHLSILVWSAQRRHPADPDSEEEPDEDDEEPS